MISFKITWFLIYKRFDISIYGYSSYLYCVFKMESTFVPAIQVALGVNLIQSQSSLLFLGLKLLDQIPGVSSFSVLHIFLFIPPVILLVIRVASFPRLLIRRILPQDFIVGLSLSWLPLLELWSTVSSLSFLTFPGKGWIACLGKSDIFLIWRLSIDPVTWKSTLVPILIIWWLFSEVAWGSINRPVLIGSILQGRVIFNDVRLHLIPW